jgi:hypothetical protein
MKIMSFCFVAFVLVACASKKEPTQDEPAPATKPTATAPAPAADKPAAAAAPAAAPEAAQLSCTNPSGSQCTEFPGGDAGLVKQTCDMMNGKFAASACPQKGRLGTCELSAMHKRMSYYGGGEDKLTTDLAKKDCGVVSGSWQP